jgi:hypothetical protein
MEIHNNKNQISTGAAIAFSFGGIIIVAILIAGALAWRSVDLFENTLDDFVREGVIQIEINDLSGQLEVNEN